MKCITYLHWFTIVKSCISNRWNGDNSSMYTHSRVYAWNGTTRCEEHFGNPFTSKSDKSLLIIQEL